MSNNGEQKKLSDSSITIEAANKFSKTAEEGEQIGCTKSKGLFLLKMKNKCSWRLRYTATNNARRKITLGNYPAVLPKEAAYLAKQMTMGLIEGADPLAEKKKRRANAIQAERKTIRLIMEGVYTRHQARKKDEGKHTLAIIKSNFSDFLDLPITAITEQDIHEWQIAREQQGRKRSTIVRAFGALKTMSRFAFDKGYIDNDPLNKVRLMQAPSVEIEKQEKRRRMLKPTEVAAIQTALIAYNESIKQKRRNSRTHGKAHLPSLDNVTYAHWFIPFCHVALHLGMRPGDIYTLDWADVNLQFKRLVKKAEKTKHHNEPTILDLPLNEVILNVLKQWHKQQKEPNEGLVFPSPATGKQLDKLAHRKSWKQIKTLAGHELPDDLQFYSLRHHFISALVSASVPLLAVAKLAGHKGTKMIEYHYGHLAPNDAANAMKALGQTLVSHTETTEDQKTVQQH